MLHSSGTTPAVTEGLRFRAHNHDEQRQVAINNIDDRFHNIRFVNRYPYVRHGDQRDVNATAHSRREAQ